jgi:hypothetical protein
MDFRKLNLITGWSVFAIATLVYVLTIEPTTSFWDCGEFITTAYKLEIGHPPGAPLFMLLGRLFSMFVPVETVPVAINVLSALSSSFTVLFLFWTITHFARKMALRNGEDDPAQNNGKIIASMAAGAVGALAFTFSDSFWFSAVEGEVYAMSSLFTAAVFWAILRWESLSNGKNEMRWIIAIAYLMGLSIGVHLLNLLAIPAICFVVYFKRNTPTTRGILITGLISLVILGIIQSGIIPGVVSLAGDFELFFVNDLGLPFNTGVIVYALIVIAALAYGLYYTQKKNKPVWNTAILSVVVIILGYSTFATIVIRSSANPPLDENNPENVFTLLSYLNREQYGDRPLLYGQYFNTPADPRNPRSDGDPVYAKAWTVKAKTGRMVEWFSERFDAEQYIAKAEQPYELGHEYVVSDDGKGTVINYDPQFEAIFPRMYSAQGNHVQAYKNWSDFQGKPIRTVGQDGQPTLINKPTFTENMRFFFRYQFNFMYWRYFMWNFAGRQNDIQGHGDLLSGNWLSGVDFIDKERLGSQENLPSSMTSNFAYNKFYLLPLILGLMGFLYQLYRRPDDWFVTLLLFLLTGIAIVIYLNQTPFQPRERDYAYAGSFYAFAIWIGLGVYALFDSAFHLKKKHLINTAGAVFGAGAVIYLFESIQDNSHFFSYSILYMGVIGVGAIALFYFLGKSYKAATPLAILAALLTLPVPLLMAAQGWDDHDRSNRYTARDFAANYLETCEPNSIIFTNGDNDTFPLWYAQEVEGIRTDVRVVNLSLLNTDWYINQMKRKAYESDPIPFSLTETKYRQGTRDIVLLDEQQNPNRVPVNVDNAIAYIARDESMRPVGGGAKLAVLPTKNFYVEVPREKVLANGTVSPKDTANMVDRVEWRIDRSYLTKNNLMQLDLLATNDWERPIYFAVTTGPDSYINLEDYFMLEGLAYRLTPIKSERSRNPNLYGTVNTEVMYENVMNKFQWGGMDGEEQIYMDENNLRMTNNLRLQFANLAEKLIEEQKETKALNVLDKCVEVMPHHNVPYDKLMVPIVESYYEIGENDKANEITTMLFDRYEEDFEYYMTLDPKFALQVQQDIQVAYSVLRRLRDDVVSRYPQEGLSEDVNARFEALDKAFDAKIQEIEAYRTQPRMKF